MDAPAENATHTPSKRSGNPSGFDVFLATGAGVGLIAPFAPGTFGSLWGVLLAWGAAIWLPAVWMHGALIVVLFAVGVPLCTSTARKLGKKDPGAIVWDEIASVPITYLFVPAALMNNPLVLLAGFVAIRFFDIAKPPPVRQLEKLPTGLGIMADDTIAGIYSCGALHLFLWAFGWTSF